MEGKYYARWKSSLTREKVLTHPAFAKTRLSAEQLGIASKISSSIYSDLPIGWRQKWMHEQFTGEAKIMLQKEHTPQEAYEYLWKTYVEYWALYQHVTGIPLKTGRTFRKKAKPKTHKTILKHRGSDDKYSRRYYNQLGKRHRRSSYDHMKDLLLIDEKRRRKALNDAAWQRLLEKEKRIAEEKALAAQTNKKPTIVLPKAVSLHPFPTYLDCKYHSQATMRRINKMNQRNKRDRRSPCPRNKASRKEMASHPPARAMTPV
jgi:hypothetical protein